MTQDNDIRLLEDERFTAMLDADTDALERLLHPGLGYGHSNAQRETKSSLIEKIGSGVLDYASIDHPITEIVVVGDTAVVVGSMTASVRIAGRPVQLNSSTISVWVRVGDTWQLLAFQPTPVPAASPVPAATAAEAQS